MGDDVEAVFRREYPRLWRSLYGFSGDAEIASEATAEVFAQAIGRGAAIRDLPAWLWRSAFAICRGMLADQRGAAMSMDDPDTERAVEAGVSRPPTELDEVVGLVDLLGRLRPEDRELIVLCHVAGFSPAEIANHRSVTAGAVRVQLHRARRRLENLLEETDD